MSEPTTVSEAAAAQANPERPSIVESIVAGLSIETDCEESNQRHTDGADALDQSQSGNADTFRTDVSGSLDSVDAMIEAAVEAEIQREDGAALLIQRTYRGHATRVELKLEREVEGEMNAAATLIQSVWRGHSVRTSDTNQVDASASAADHNNTHKDEEKGALETEAKHDDSDDAPNRVSLDHNTPSSPPSSAAAAAADNGGDAAGVNPAPQNKKVDASPSPPYAAASNAHSLPPTHTLTQEMGKGGDVNERAATTVQSTADLEAEMQAALAIQRAYRGHVVRLNLHRARRSQQLQSEDRETAQEAKKNTESLSSSSPLLSSSSTSSVRANDGNDSSADKAGDAKTSRECAVTLPTSPLEIDTTHTRIDTQRTPSSSPPPPSSAPSAPSSHIHTRTHEGRHEALMGQQGRALKMSQHTSRKPIGPGGLYGLESPRARAMARAYGDRIRKRPPPRKVDLKRVHALADKLPRRIQILPTAKFAKKPMERVIVEQIVAENAAKLEAKQKQQREEQATWAELDQLQAKEAQLAAEQASWQKHLDFVSVCQRRRNDADQRKAHAQHMSRQDFLMHKEASDAWERGKRNFDAYVSENKARVRQEKEAKRQEMLAFKAKQRRLREEKSKAVEQARNSFRLEQQAARDQLQAVKRARIMAQRKRTEGASTQRKLRVITQVLAGGVAPDSEATAGFAYWIRSADSVLPRPQAPAKAKKRASTPKNTSMQVPAKPSDPRPWRSARGFSRRKKEEQKRSSAHFSKRGANGANDRGLSLTVEVHREEMERKFKQMGDDGPNLMIHSPRSSRPTSSESKVRFSPEAGVDAQVYEFNVVGSEPTHTQKQGRGVNKLYDDLSMWISKLYAH